MAKIDHYLTTYQVKLKIRGNYPRLFTTLLNIHFEAKRWLKLKCAE
jgi:hypothetical protein